MADPPGLSLLLLPLHFPGSSISWLNLGAESAKAFSFILWGFHLHNPECENDVKWSVMLMTIIVNGAVMLMVIRWPWEPKREWFYLMGWEGLMGGGAQRALRNEQDCQRWSWEPGGGRKRGNGLGGGSRWACVWERGAVRPQANRYRIPGAGLQTTGLAVEMASPTGASSLPSPRGKCKC